MNKIIKYGVVAGLTMAAFSLATVSATYASTVEPVSCAEASALVDGATVEIALADTTCVLKYTFAEELGSHTSMSGVVYDAPTPTFSGVNLSKVNILSGVGDYETKVVDSQNIDITFNAGALNKIRTAAKTGAVSMTVKNGTETFVTYLTAETVKPALDVNGVVASGNTAELKIKEGDSVVIKTTFPTELAATTAITGNKVKVEGLTTGSGISMKYGYTATTDGHVATITLNADGIQMVKDAGDDGLTVTITDAEDADVTFKVKLTFQEKVELESVSAVINDGNEIVLTYNEGYEVAEDTPTVEYTVEEDYKDIVTVENGVVKVAETYKTATDKDVVITVKATDGETVSTTVTYTIKANYTTVEASFADDKDTIKVSGDTTIVIEKVAGVEYEYVYDDVRLAIDKDGKVTVNEDTLLGEDTKFTITVKAIVDDVVIAEKDLTLTVEKNYTASFEKPLFEIIDGAKIEAGKPVVVEIDAKMDGLWNIVVFNKALFEKYLNGEDMTEEELENMAYQLAEDDCTVTEGSTIITLSDAFLAKLPAGDYLLRAYFYDNSDVDDVKKGYAESVFSVAAVPDTGAYTASTSATSSVFASVLAAITAAGAAVATKFAKRK